MKPEIKLAIEVLEAAGHTVMLKQELKSEKFVPFKGQVGYVYDINRENRRLSRFIEIRNDKYQCTQLDNLDTIGVDWENFEPIPGLVQMEPYDPSYTGEANVLYENGRIFCFAGATRAHDTSWTDVYGKPVFFQKLEK